MALEGNNIVDETQLTKLGFNDSLGSKVGPFADSGWYQLVADANCYIKIVSPTAAALGIDAAAVTSATGCDLFSGNGEKWYIPKGGFLGAVGYAGKTGDIRIHRVGK